MSEGPQHGVGKKWVKMTKPGGKSHHRRINGVLLEPRGGQPLKMRGFKEVFLKETPELSFAE